MNKRVLKRQENAIKRLVKAFGYNTVTGFKMGFSDCQFVEKGVTIIIKAKE